MYLFIYGCVGSSFLCEGLPQLRQAGATLHRGARASHYRGPPPAAEHRLQTRRLSNCGSRAQLLRGMRDLSRPGLEPVSPALAGRLSTTAPPGKPLQAFLKCGLFARLCAVPRNPEMRLSWPWSSRSSQAMEGGGRVKVAL